MMRALLLVAACAGAARADVAWNAPAGCPTADAVRARIGDGLELRVDVTRDRARFVAHLALGEETRELTARRCDDLADAVVVIVARLARQQHQVVVVEDEPAPALDLEMPAVYVRRAPSPVPPLPLPTEDDHWGFGMRLTGLSGIGAVPQVGVGAELAGYLRHDDHFLELGTSTWQTASGFRDMPGLGLQLATVRGGWAPRELPIRIWGQGEVGGMGASEVGMPVQRWTALGGGFGLAWPMHPNARLIGAFEAVVPVERPAFVGYEPSAIATRVSFGIEVGWK